jgi:hypothetical protein
LAVLYAAAEVCPADQNYSDYGRRRGMKVLVAKQLPELVTTYQGLH